MIMLSTCLNQEPACAAAASHWPGQQLLPSMASLKLNQPSLRHMRLAHTAVSGCLSSDCTPGGLQMLSF